MCDGNDARWLSRWPGALQRVARELAPGRLSFVHILSGQGSRYSDVRQAAAEEKGGGVGTRGSRLYTDCRSFLRRIGTRRLAWWRPDRSWSREGASGRRGRGSHPVPEGGVCATRGNDKRLGATATRCGDTIQCSSLLTCSLHASLGGAATSRCFLARVNARILKNTFRRRAYIPRGASLALALWGRLGRQFASLSASPVRGRAVRQALACPTGHSRRCTGPAGAPGGHTPASARLVRSGTAERKKPGICEYGKSREFANGPVAASSRVLRSRPACVRAYLTRRARRAIQNLGRWWRSAVQGTHACTFVGQGPRTRRGPTVTRASSRPTKARSASRT